MKNEVGVTGFQEGREWSGKIAPIHSVLSCVLSIGQADGPGTLFAKGMGVHAGWLAGTAKYLTFFAPLVLHNLFVPAWLLTTTTSA